MDRRRVLPDPPAAFGVLSLSPRARAHPCSAECDLVQGSALMRIKPRASADMYYHQLAGPAGTPTIARGNERKE